MRLCIPYLIIKNGHHNSKGDQQWPNLRFWQKVKSCKYWKSITYRILMYPDPGSNRDGLPHWCLRPARLPIPPSGQSLYLSIASAKVVHFFYLAKKNGFFLKKSFIFLPIPYESSNFASRLLSAQTMGAQCFRSLSLLKWLNPANWSGMARRGFLKSRFP